MTRDYQQSPLLTVGEVACFLNARADTVRWWSERSASHGCQVEPGGWLTLQIRKRDGAGHSFSLPVARVGVAEKGTGLRTVHFHGRFGRLVEQPGAIQREIAVVEK